MATTRRHFCLTGLGAAGAWALAPLESGTLAAWGQAGDQTAAAFLAAARAGDTAAMARLLSTAPGLLQARDDDGRTAFALAMLHGRAEAGDWLRARGYEIDLHEAALALDWDRFNALAAEPGAAIDADHPIGGTAMYAAARGGAGSDIWRVYAVDGEPDAVPGGRDHATPLQAALRHPDLATAEMTAATLLANAASANPAARGDDPPIAIAAARGSLEIVEMLIRLGADPEARARDGRTPLEAAVGAGHEDVARLLEAPGRIPRTHSTSKTAYDAAGRPYAPPPIDDLPQAARSGFVGISHGRLDAVRIETGRDPRLVHSMATTGELAVEACAHTGQQAIVEFLLERGAPCSLPTAVMRHDRARASALLDEDPRRIHERGAHDFALLWYPVIGEAPIAMTEWLLDRGAVVEQQHHLGTTALHWAALRGRLDLVDLLIARGADVNRRGRKFNAAGETPIDVARRGGHDAVVELLRARGARG